MRARILLAALLLAVSAAAQQRPIFDPDDFLEPPQLRGRPLFVSRVVVGGVANAVDHYRPLHQHVGFVHVANSVYWRRVQFDYKRTEMRDGPIRVQRCDCPDPVYFPTPPPDDAIPAAPPPSAKDMLQFAFYVPAGGSGRVPAWLRYRGSWSRRTIETVVTARETGRESRLSGREESLGLEGDAFIPVRGRRLFGTLYFSRLVREGTTDDRTQNELVYVTRFPGRALGPLLARATLGLGGVSNRGGTALNVVQPSFEAFWRHAPSRVNLHLIWSPAMLNSGANGWKTTHQVALYADRGFLTLFGRKR